MLHEQLEWARNFPLVKYDEYYYVWGKKRDKAPLFCKYCVDMMCREKAIRPFIFIYIYSFIVLREETLRRVIFVWNETETRAHLHLFFLPICNIFQAATHL